MAIRHFAFFLLLQLQTAYAVPVANCDATKPYIVDSVNRCIFYQCAGWSFYQYTYACPGNTETKLEALSPSMPCTVTPSSCPLGSNAPATVTFSGYTFATPTPAPTTTTTAGSNAPATVTFSGYTFATPTPAPTTTTTAVPVIAKISGDAEITKTDLTQIKVDGSPSSGPGTLTYSWSCTEHSYTVGESTPTAHFSSSKCPLHMAYITYTSTNVVWLQPISSDRGKTLTFRLKVESGGVSSWTHQVYHMGSTPTLTITRTENTCQYVDSSSDVTFKVECDNCGTNTGVTYSWVVKNTDPDPSITLNLTDSTEDELKLAVGSLDADKTYKATISYNCNECAATTQSVTFQTKSDSKTSCAGDVGSSSPCFPDIPLTTLTDQTEMRFTAYNLAISCTGTAYGVSFYALTTGKFYFYVIYNESSTAKIRSVTEIEATGVGVHIVNFTSSVTVKENDFIAISYESASSKVIIPYASSESSNLNSTGLTKDKLYPYVVYSKYGKLSGDLAYSITFSSTKFQAPALRVHVTPVDPLSVAPCFQDTLLTELTKADNAANTRMQIYNLRIKCNGTLHGLSFYAIDTGHFYLHILYFDGDDVIVRDALTVTATTIGINNMTLDNRTSVYENDFIGVNYDKGIAKKPLAFAASTAASFPLTGLSLSNMVSYRSLYVYGKQSVGTVLTSSLTWSTKKLKHPAIRLNITDVDPLSVAPCFQDTILTELTKPNNSPTNYMMVYNFPIKCNGTLQSLSFYAIETGHFYLHILYNYTENVIVRDAFTVYATTIGINNVTLANGTLVYENDFIGVNYDDGGTAQPLAYAWSRASSFSNTGLSLSDMVRWQKVEITGKQSVGSAVTSSLTWRSDYLRHPAIRLNVTEGTTTTTTATTSTTTEVTSTTTATSTTTEIDRLSVAPCFQDTLLTEMTKADNNPSSKMTIYNLTIKCNGTLQGLSFYAIETGSFYFYIVYFNSIDQVIVRDAQTIEATTVGINTVTLANGPVVYENDFIGVNYDSSAREKPLAYAKPDVPSFALSGLTSSDMVSYQDFKIYGKKIVGKVITSSSTWKATKLKLPAIRLNITGATTTTTTPLTTTEATTTTTTPLTTTEVPLPTTTTAAPSTTTETAKCINVTLPVEYSSPETPYSQSLAVGQSTLSIRAVVHDGCLVPGIITWKYRTYPAASEEFTTIPSATGNTLSWPVTEAGTYQIRAEVSGQPDIYSDMYARVEVTELMARIQGGDTKMTTSGRAFTLDGSESYDPDDRTNTRGSLSYSWSCRTGLLTKTKPSAHFESDHCPSALAWLFSSKESKIEVTTPLSAGQYTFRLAVSKTGRTSYSDQVITIVDGFVPDMKIKCFINCGSKMVTSSRVSLLLECAECMALEGITYEWVLQKKVEKTTTYNTLNTEGLTSTGSSSLGYSLKAHALEEGSAYLMTTTVSCKTCHTSSTTFTFETNTAPTGGSCSIDPLEGEAVLTKFTIICSGWTSADKLPIFYRMETKSKDSMNLIYYGTSPVSNKFPLTMGKSNNQTEIIVTVIDTLGSFSNMSIFVKVMRPSPSSSGASMADMASSMDALDPDDTQGSAQTIQAMASLLNIQTADSSEVEVSATSDTDATSSRSEVRQKMVTQIKEISSKVTNINDIIMVGGALELSTNAESEVNTQAMDDAAAALSTLTGTAATMLATRPEQAVRVTQNLLPATWNIQYATKPQAEVPTEAPVPLDEEGIAKMLEEEEANPLSPEERAYEDRKRQIKLERQRLNSERVAKSLSSAGNSIVDLVMGTLTPGEEPVVIESSKASSSIQKVSLEDLANKTITSAYGSTVRMPNFLPTAGINTTVRVEAKSSTYKSNPFLWGSNSASVNTPVTTVNTTDEDGTPRQLDEPIAVTISSSQKISPTEVSLNSSLNAQTGMVYHKVNVTMAGSSVMLQLQPPASADAVEIYMEPLVQPTLIRYVYRNEVNMTSLRASGISSLPVTIPAKYITKVGIHFIGVRPVTQERGSRRKRSLSANNTSDTYSIAIGTSSCRVWDSDLNVWVNSGELVAEESSLSSTTCRVTPTPSQSSFGLSFIAPPNMIDFSTVWAKFADLKNNAAVFSIVICFILLYLVGLVFAVREDRKDERRWAAQPLADNIGIDEEEYLVTVETGLKRGAGTSANVWCILYGTESSTGSRNLEGNTRMGFPLGSCRTFIMKTPRALGRLCSLRLWHDGRKSHWYVQSITILHVRTNTMYSFLCSSWLSRTKGDGSREKMFRAATAAERLRFSFLYSRSAQSAVTDSHIWLSVVLRPIRSRFTRAQRLSCCLATLFLSMVTSAMFYGTEDNVEKPGMVRLGPFTFSYQELWVSLVSAIIAVPPLALVIQIFRKAKSREEDRFTDINSGNGSKGMGLKRKSTFLNLNSSKVTSYSDSADSLGRTVTPFDPVNGLDLEKKERTFPWWTLLIGWFLVTCSILVPAFFVILYSMDWGPEVSGAWLTAYFLSFFESMFCMEPVKVILIALIAAALIYRGKMKTMEPEPEVEDEYEDNYDYFNKLYGGGNAASDREKRAAKLAREREATAKVRYLVVHCVYLACIIMVGIGAVDPNSYPVYKTAHDTFIPTFHAKVSSRASFFSYVQTYFIPSYFVTTDVNGNTLPWRLRGFTSDVTAYRVGPARFRQLRVYEANCPLSPRLSYGLIPKTRPCYPYYSAPTEGHTQYTPAVIFNDTYQETYETRDAWQFHSSDTLRGEPTFASFGNYEGGGYVAKFDINPSISETIVQELKDNKWLDRQSRAVMIEFTTFNPNVNLFTYVTMVTEFLPSGGTVLYSSVQVLQGYALGFFTVVVYISGLVAIAFTIYYTVIEALKFRKEKKAYFSSVANWVSMAIVVTVLVSIILFALRMVETNHVMSIMKQDLNAYVPFRRVALLDEGYRVTIAFLNCFAFWKLILLMKVNKRFDNFMKVLQDSLAPLGSFMVIFSILIFAFAALGYLLYMNMSLMDYRSITATVTTLLLAFVGDFDVEDLVQNDPLGSSRLYFSVYMMTMNMLMVNIIVAILCESEAALEVDPNHMADMDVLIAKVWPESKEKSSEVNTAYQPQQAWVREKDLSQEEALRKDAVIWLTPNGPNDFVPI